MYFCCLLQNIQKQPTAKIQTDTRISKLNLIQKCGSNIGEQKKRVKLLKPVNEPLISIAYKLNVFCTLTLKLLTPY